MITGKSERERIQRHSSRPSVPGSITSRTTRPGEPLRLTAKEFDLLYFLARHPRQVFSRRQLMESVWGYEAALDTGTVTVHVRRLREKLEEDASNPQLLETVWGVGYRLRG